MPAGVPQHLVVTGRSTDTVNVRVRGSRAGLRSLSVADTEYEVDLSGAKNGTTSVEVDTTQVDLPRGAQIVSRSPASIDFELERRGTKAVKLRPDIDGDPAPGYRILRVEVEPPQIRITGARSEVLRINELLTETVDVTGANELVERSVKASLVGRNLWLERDEEIQVRVWIEAELAPTEAEEAE